MKQTFLFIIALTLLGCKDNSKSEKQHIEEAFVIVNEGLEKTTEEYLRKNEEIYAKFNAEYNIGELKKYADLVKSNSDALYNQIENFKIKIIEAAGDEEAISEKTGRIDGSKIKRKDNIDIPTQIMIVEQKGNELKHKMDEVRSDHLNIIKLLKQQNPDTEIKTQIEQFLSTDDYVDERSGEHLPWDSYHFEHLPIMAVITILSKMQGDVRNAEAAMINFIIQIIDSDGTIQQYADSMVSSMNKLKTVVFEAAYGNVDSIVIFEADYDENMATEE